MNSPVKNHKRETRNRAVASSLPKNDAKESKLSTQLKQKSIDGFLNCVERFNSPREQGRVDAVLILLGHACEMLLKAALVYKGADIHSGKHNTLSLWDCIGECMPNGGTPILPNEYDFPLRTISSLRNNAQHFHVEVGEEMLYYCTSSGISVFRTVMDSVYGEKPDALMPGRVLSFAESPPLNVFNIFTKGAEDVARKLERKDRESASARLRGLVAMENAVDGKEIVPDDTQIERLLVKISQQPNSGIDVIFPLVASTKKISKTLEMPVHEVKKGGRPFTVVPDDAPAAERVIVKEKKVPGDNYYRFIMKEIQSKIGVNQLEARALEYSLGLRGKQKYHRKGRYGENFYSEETLDAMSKAGARFKREQSYREQVLAKYKARKIKKK